MGYCSVIIYHQAFNINILVKWTVIWCNIMQNVFYNVKGQQMPDKWSEHTAVTKIFSHHGISLVCRCVCKNVINAIRYLSCYKENSSPHKINIMKFGCRSIYISWAVSTLLFCIIQITARHGISTGMCRWCLQTNTLYDLGFHKESSGRHRSVPWRLCADGCTLLSNFKFCFVSLFSYRPLISWHFSWVFTFDFTNICSITLTVYKIWKYLNYRNVGTDKCTPSRNLSEF